MGSKKKEKEGGWLVEPLRVGVGTVVGVPSSWSWRAALGTTHTHRGLGRLEARALSLV